MWKYLLTLLTFFFLSYSSNAYTQTASLYNHYQVCNFVEMENYSIKDSSRMQMAAAIKRRDFTDFTLDSQYSNQLFNNLKAKQQIPGKKKRDNYRKEKNELERELQVQIKELIKEIYEQALRLNIEMPPYPDPPYSEKQIEIFIDYYQQEFGDKVINTIEYVENEKNRRKTEEEKNTKEIMNIVFDLADKIYYSAESDDPILALKELEEDFYYKRSMEYLKEINDEHYRLVLREYMHVLRLMEKKKPVVILKNTEIDVESLCKKFCSNN